MDDGYSPVGILVLIGLIFLEAVFYGFGSAIQNVNEGKLEEEMENGNEKAARLLRIVNRPTRFVNTIQITTHLVGIITGIFILPVVVNAAAGKLKTMNLLNPARTMEAVGGTAPAWYADPLWWMWAGLMVLFTVAAVVLIVSFGIIIPKRLAAKEPEKWGYRMMPMVLFVAALLLPLTKLISAMAWLVLKGFGVDNCVVTGVTLSGGVLSVTADLSRHPQGSPLTMSLFDVGKRVRRVILNGEEIAAGPWQTFPEKLSFQN